MKMLLFFKDPLYSMEKVKALLIGAIAVTFFLALAMETISEHCLYKARGFRI
jgi:hypothetical protein